MSKRKLVTREQLMKLTRKARGERGQKEIADRFGVSQEAVSRAETDPNSSTDKLRMSIIEEYLGLTVNGPTPYFEIIGAEDESPAQ